MDKRTQQFLTSDERKHIGADAAAGWTALCCFLALGPLISGMLNTGSTLHALMIALLILNAFIGLLALFTFESLVDESAAKLRAEELREAWDGLVIPLVNAPDLPVEGYKFLHSKYLTNDDQVLFCAEWARWNEQRPGWINYSGKEQAPDDVADEGYDIDDPALAEKWIDFVFRADQHNRIYYEKWKLHRELVESRSQFALPSPNKILS